ncbi:hypothetical protein GLOTRDRAFT_119710 [Gloeophyllum trabeum ATCC 11539]|uniref:Novel STAND NTPase 1 domain-containing protein n=1 Tax=Gloeophyllum trabeum (strain ATCC 11539 / FP-39264 / Madison 617) TaxID=670483 RepID=S7QKF8_GLOTA|nr:uncharacterized protein GLOTRDRAFT_119710 [Gloeophyllum trabeum ATCC 11539]EPQ59728.1 hypothetical protein GLOTRDRAFT_119710 [Gloeophyllum trabeum ATCC 11539]
MAPAKLKESKKSLVALGHLKEALSGVAYIADAMNAPFVKAGLQVAIKLIDTAECTVKNKSDCHELARTAAQTMLDLAESLKGKRLEDISASLQLQLENLQSKMLDICRGMEEMTARSSFKRFIAGKLDADMIASWKKYLEDARWKFIQHGDINIQVGVAQINRKLDIMSGSRWDEQTNNAQRIPPPMPSIFHGRETEVSNAVDKILGPTQTHLAILGSGGMGKTSLALAILHHPQIKHHFKDHIYFVPCDSATSPDQLVSHILTTLAVQKKHGQDILTSLNAFLQAVPQLLLVLDNFETPYYDTENNQGIVQVLSRITCVPQVTLVITMRGNSTPRGAIWGDALELRPISLEASRKIFFDITQQHQDDVLDRLLEKLDYIPLAVTLVSHLAKSESVSHLLRQWERQKTAMLQDDTANEKHNNVQISIELSLQSKIVQQAKDALPLLALISGLPDGLLAVSQIEDEDGLEKLEAMTPHMEDRDMALKALLKAGLVQKTGDNLTVLSPIQYYVLKQCPLGAVHRRALENYFITLIQKHFHHFNDTLSRESGNITALLKHACQSKHDIYAEILMAAYKMSWFLINHNIPQAQLLFDSLLPLVVEMNGGVFLVECEVLAGITLLRQGRNTAAQKQIEQTLKRSQELNYTSGISQSHHCLGMILRMQDQYAEAVAHFRLAIPGYQQSQQPDRVAACHTAMGDMLRLEGKPAEAVIQLKEAFSLAKQVGSHDTIAECLWSMGECLRMQRQHTEAVQKLEESLAYYKETKNKPSMAQCLWSLANILLFEKKHIQAQAMLQEAVKLHKEVNNKGGVAECYGSMALVALRMGPEGMDNALRLVGASMIIWHELSDYSGIAMTFRLGLPEQAAECAQELQHNLQLAADFMAYHGGHSE